MQAGLLVVVSVRKSSRDNMFHSVYFIAYASKDSGEDITPDMKLLGNKASNCTDALHKKRRQVKSGTCQWILDPRICPRYSEWDQASNSDFLLITAPPGYGKSVLCAFLEGQLPFRSYGPCFDLKKNNLDKKRVRSACTSFAMTNPNREEPSCKFSGRLYIN
jgi:hypothetical protein